MTQEPGGSRIPLPGKLIADDLGTLLTIGNRPGITDQLHQELQAVRDAERRAENAIEDVRLY